MPDSRPPSVSRRDFLQIAGLNAASLDANALMAGPFAQDEFKRLIPEDKRLTPAWVKSLTYRGKPEVWSGRQLGHIGMPVGGIGCGQLYIGGDGRLWNWQVFQSATSTDYEGKIWAGPHYEHPLKQVSEVRHGFSVAVKQGRFELCRMLDSAGFSKVEFRGEYPVARVRYFDPAFPLEVTRDTFSPFVPLNTSESGLPATCIRFHLRNMSKQDLTATLSGWVENPVCRPLDSGHGVARTVSTPIIPGAAGFLHEAQLSPLPGRSTPDILFEDFEGDTWGQWTVEGSAFGPRPYRDTERRFYTALQNFKGHGFVNSHHMRNGEDATRADSYKGKLISKEFTIERAFIRFLIGGGNRLGQLGLQLIVDGKVVRRETGRDAGAMRQAVFDVREFMGKTGHVEIIDLADGGWGHTTIDEIVFSNRARDLDTLEAIPGYGNLALYVLGDDPTQVSATPVGRSRASIQMLAQTTARVLGAPPDAAEALSPACATKRVAIPAGGAVVVDYVLSWWFPYYTEISGEMAAITEMGRLTRHYARRFESAKAVAEHVIANHKQLVDDTLLWNRTWYDSTLPHWLLDRLFVPITTLATQTVHRFDNGRWWGWEGVDCCPGTCQHVWQYAQSAARIFPEFERDLRERVDFGLAWRESGAMDFRAENDRSVAHDGFCGTILRVYREHQMSPNRAFLRRLWPRIRKSVEFILAQDVDRDGLLEGEQMNTLDTPWMGPMAWISSLFLAALEAGSSMAREMGDKEFADRLNERVAAGRRSLVDKLFNGEYFIHRPPDFSRNNTNDGCHMDQLMGQAYAHQLGLPRLVDSKHARSALQSLWRYNFTPDVGPYRSNFKKVAGGRWYAMPGEAGMIVCTFPKGGGENAVGKQGSGFAGYFNECWTGFEYQVAAHMVWEGMVTEGLAMCKAIHERHAPEKRNPYNEVECSDHYSRAMSSHGVLLALCGYEHHGPAGHLGFAPKLTPERFKAPFTTCEGWGTYRQDRNGNSQSHRIEVKYGKLRLKTLALEVPAGWKSVAASMRIGGQPVGFRVRQSGARVEIELARVGVVGAGGRVEVRLSGS